MPELKFKVDEKEKVPSALDIFSSWLRYHGLKYTFHKSYEAISKSINIVDFIRNNLSLAGILDGRVAYSGPETVEIDLTNNCNCHCAGCWCHSYLLGDSMLSGNEKKRHLSYKTVKDLIDDLYEMGTKTIQISGSGEPFMHPQIMQILEYIKKKKIECKIITNFTLVNEDMLRRLIDLRIDSITVSLWAGAPETYERIHPGIPKDTFYRIKRLLKLAYQLKGNIFYPHIKIYNVISKLNCHELNEMLDFALEAHVDFLEFTVIDTIPGKTDSLALSLLNREDILEQCRMLEERIDYPRSPQWGVEIKQIRLLDGQHKQEILGFGKYRKRPFSGREVSKLISSYSNQYIDEGIFRDCDFNFELTQLHKLRVWCPAGHSTHYQHYDEDRNAFVFEFKKSQCKDCSLRCWCITDGRARQVKAEYLSLLGFGSFYRRIMNIGKSLQDEKDRIVDTLACYAGWIYSRVRVNGDVIPCCKAHRMPMGNLYKHSFKEIWNSERQQEFRDKAKNLKKSDPYFSPIGCYKGCDNLGENLKIHKHIAALTRIQKALINFSKPFAKRT